VKKNWDRGAKTGREAQNGIGKTQNTKRGIGNGDEKRERERRRGDR
jgi:hypothetical protein